MLTRPLTDYCSHVAVIFDDDGKFLTKKRLVYSSPHFEHNKRVYNFLPLYSTRFKFSTLFSSRKFYFYNYRNPNPINFIPSKSPLIESDVYKAVIENKLIKDLHDLSRNKLLDFFTPRIIFPLLVVGATIYYFLSGGSLL